MPGGFEICEAILCEWNRSQTKVRETKPPICFDEYCVAGLSVSGVLTLSAQDMSHRSAAFDSIDTSENGIR